MRILLPPILYKLTKLYILEKTYLSHTLFIYYFYFSKVGAVDIDSGWSTGFNNFIFDTDKYPNASAMVLNSDPTIELHF